MLRSLSALVLVGFSLVGCSSARIVHDTRTGGTVALRGPRDSAHEKAETLMRDKCPAGYTVVEQGEVPYGQTSYTQASYSRGFGVAQTQTTQQTEWQITFHCNGSQASAAPIVIRF